MHPQRPRSRSPQFRRRAYSPSRPLSPGLQARYDTDHPYDRPPPPQRAWSPPPRRSPPPPARRYDEPPYPGRRYDSPSPPQRYAGEQYPEQYAGRLPYEPQGRYDDRAGGARYGDEVEGRERWVPPPRVREDDYERRYEYEGGPAVNRKEPRRTEGQWERGRDADHAWYDAPYGQEQGKRGKPMAEPSKDLIFLGLDPELSEDDFFGYLQAEHRAKVSNVKIVRDRATGVSKGFGFAAFHSVEDAMDFIRYNGASIAMPALYAHSEVRKVRIDYAEPQPQAPGGPHGDYPSGPAYVRPGHDGMRDIGAPGGGMRVLLLRGLDATTTTEEIVHRMGEEIARMMGKGGREQLAESTVVRAILIVDRAARSSWGYGFVELATAELASALLPFLLTPQHQPNGFLINTVPVAASFAKDAFEPTSAGPLGGEFILRPSRFGGIGNAALDNPSGQWCAYWHERAGAVELTPPGAPVIGGDGTVELTPDHRSFLGGLAGVPPLRQEAAQAQVQAQAATQGAGMMPINLGGAMQPIKIGGKGKKKEEAVLVPITQIGQKNVLGDDDEDEEDKIGKDTVLLSRTKGVRIIPPTSSSRKIAKNISKWNTKQNELAKPEAVEENAPPKGMSDANMALGVRRPIGMSANTGASSSAPASASPAPAPAPVRTADAPAASPGDEFDYTDTSNFAATGKVACLLCQRQFKTEDILRKHVAQSDLHKARLRFHLFYLFPQSGLPNRPWVQGTLNGVADLRPLPSMLGLVKQTNLQDSAVCEAGQRRKVATSTSSPAPSSSATPEPSAPKYRDRAAERRTAFHQPAVPRPADLAAMATSIPITSYKRKPLPGASASFPGPRPPSPPPARAMDAELPQENVGNQLLAKMGWKTGEGLGVGGEGRKDPIKVQQFENRAGLGAAKGVEAGRWSGKGGWQQRAKDMTKERYNAEEK
ncbi:hypothetical protein IAT38_005676 [Cryptococcus sp. DSM 104549]